MQLHEYSLTSHSIVHVGTYDSNWKWNDLSDTSHYRSIAYKRS